MSLYSDLSKKPGVSVWTLIAGTAIAVVALVLLKVLL